ncbi:acyltransferase [Helicobacter fennelliae]|uniref:2,3,4,5-tetrahydropyridine-2,6-dicarboxylate N-acetyltransferase n=2 Tax=Helicobacter fennelliae TaxID=215 RepID=T1D4A8_9HELI|nr:acyltransferase [Helicobacter fennelliae]SQB98640.1 hexapeptide transferase family protein [Helicobacter fennelliae]STP07981.1 hexapeptide transferase family protein [Helicobacter fennelliae]STQ84110.1 hexapeptide transferase family protein [Helicobacter fennelliae]GAD19828.1 2,3,4,5-tetrahydropyridine-2,6-dicarboxylate N-acetyltransferase [Helicobacter fennelliae MRY12-0050]GAD20036.1 2,3,4,5-tetrahydropyridine-2,6-dicarboxylate N-acetyltransferase [Helicobacter fennelliae MRY12-0050]
MNTTIHKTMIHQSSFIDERVTIGESVRVWHFCHILSGSIIGDCVNIGQNCMIGPNVIIGCGCKIQNNVSIYEGVKLEEDVFVGPSVVFSNVINPRAFIVRKHQYKPTLLKRGCSIGANATIVCGVEIGEYAFIGAGAVITKDVKNFALMVGNPARQIGWVDKAGIRLEFDERHRAQSAYDGSIYVYKDEAVYLL